MLLNEHALTQDQVHFEGKRWLLSRLTLGVGVLSGLSYKLAATAADLPPCAGAREPGPWVVLEPGVALDDCGREVVVPSGTAAAGRVFPVALEDPDGGRPVGTARRSSAWRAG